MTLYLIYKEYEGVRQRVELFEEACRLKGIRFHPLCSTTIDYTNLPTLLPGDLLYNCSDGSEMLENLLIEEHTSTFYRSRVPIVTNNSDTVKYSIIHHKLRLPSPKTIFSITTDREVLKRYVVYLNGFPLVIKQTGSSRGIGTIKIESWPNLLSTVDYLCGEGKEFILREFINSTHGARVIVLNGNVVHESKFYYQENDFRNLPVVSKRDYEPVKLSKEVHKICIEAVNVINLDLGGVDIICDNEGNWHLLEVNFPVGFFSLFKNGISVVSELLEFLIQKAKQKLHHYECHQSDINCS